MPQLNIFPLQTFITTEFLHLKILIVNLKVRDYPVLFLTPWREWPFSALSLSQISLVSCNHNPGLKSLGQYCNIHIFCHFSDRFPLRTASLSKCSWSSPSPHPIRKTFWIQASNIVCGVRGCQSENAPGPGCIKPTLKCPLK